MLGHVSLTLARLNEEGVVIFGMIFAGVIIWVLTTNIRRAYETRQREQSRRDVAAYVAEGSIRPEDAATILSAGTNDTEAKIADGVAWGTIKPEKAESLIRSLKERSANSPAPS